MTPLKLKLTIYQGATFRKEITWKAGDPALPVDLTDCTARMQVRQKVDSTDVLLALTTENSRITLGGTAGTIVLEVDATDTAAITWRTGVYDLEVEFTTGDVRRLLTGTVTVDPEVTR
jgi:hypothetical protein